MKPRDFFLKNLMPDGSESHHLLGLNKCYIYIYIYYAGIIFG